MLFNSLAFAIFLPIVFFLYWALPNKYRSIFLFLSSYYFYMCWNVKYVVLILFTTVVSYVGALLLERCKEKYKKTILLGMVTVASLGVLFFFKYLDLFQNVLMRIGSLAGFSFHPITLGLMLPVGISFYTFQTLSYVIDVYKKEVDAEKNFIVYAAFISFFPQLVAGPIERTKNLLPQIKEERQFSYQQSVDGLKMMAWGFFKKLVIADGLAVYADVVYDEVQAYQGFALVLATVFFAIQIYCDFSGYSEIAVGTAKLFGIELMKNFDSPYYSGSLREFWGRWHISLSSWFKDYVYIPLGGNRKGRVRKALNQIITMALSGLWHGANYTYVCWGLMHGFGQIVEDLLPKRRRRIMTFVFVCLAWVFFRAQSVSEAVYIFTNIPVGIVTPLSYMTQGFAALKMKVADGVGIIISLTMLFVYDFIALKKAPLQMLDRLPKWGRYVFYYAFLLFVLLFASFNSQEFVYFQF